MLYSGTLFIQFYDGSSPSPGFRWPSMLNTVWVALKPLHLPHRACFSIIHFDSLASSAPNLDFARARDSKPLSHRQENPHTITVRRVDPTVCANKNRNEPKIYIGNGDAKPHCGVAVVF